MINKAGTLRRQLCSKHSQLNYGRQWPCSLFRVSSPHQPTCALILINLENWQQKWAATFHTSVTGMTDITLTLKFSCADNNMKVSQHFILSKRKKKHQEMKWVFHLIYWVVCAKKMFRDRPCKWSPFLRIFYSDKLTKRKKHSRLSTGKEIGKYIQKIQQYIYTGERSCLL